MPKFSLLLSIPNTSFFAAESPKRLPQVRVGNLEFALTFFVTLGDRQFQAASYFNF